MWLQFESFDNNTYIRHVLPFVDLKSADRIRIMSQWAPGQRSGHYWYQCRIYQKIWSYISNISNGNNTLFQNVRIESHYSSPSFLYMFRCHKDRWQRTNCLSILIAYLPTFKFNDIAFSFYCVSPYLLVRTLIDERVYYYLFFKGSLQIKI